VPELEQWNGEFWRPNREFFSKNREFSAKIESSTSGTTRKSVGRSRRLRDARTSDTLQLAARSLDQAVSVVSPLLAGPVHSILRPSLRSVGRFPSAGGTPHSLAPGWSWGSVPPRKRPLCDGHHIRRGRTAHSLLQSHSWMGGDSKEIIRALKLRNACALEDDEVAN
jgi:hypothetical protein